MKQILSQLARKHPLGIAIAAMVAMIGLSMEQSSAKAFTFIPAVVKSVSVVPPGPIRAGKPVTIICTRGASKGEILDTEKGLGHYIASSANYGNVHKPPNSVGIHVVVEWDPPQFALYGAGGIYQTLGMFFDPSYPSLTSTRTDTISWTPPENAKAKMVYISCEAESNGPPVGKTLILKFIPKVHKHQPLPSASSPPPPMRPIPSGSTFMPRNSSSVNQNASGPGASNSEVNKRGIVVVGGKPPIAPNSQNVSRSGASRSDTNKRGIVVVGGKPPIAPNSSSSSPATQITR